jgi:NAD-dependent dihydropyrimidine dehydrogenase PreA subunit
MTEHTELYTKLGELIGAPGSIRFVRILEAMVTPAEARLMLNMPEMIDCAQLAEKLKTDSKALQATLDDMADRGLIMKSKTGYSSPRNIVFFHHAAIGYIKEELRPQINPLWSDFYYNEWSNMLAEGYIKRHETGALPAHRVAPAHKALLLSPNIPPDQILWYEDLQQVLQRSIKTNLTMCGCRGMWRSCDKPVFVCLHVQFPWLPVVPGMRMRPVRGKPPRDLSAEAALKVIHSCEDRGQVHIPLNIAQADLYCNCCDDCCVVIYPLNKYGRVHDVLSPSRFRAVVDLDKCNGCQTCLERCYFSAIEMKKAPGSKKLKSSVINQNCMGCGSCVVGCPQKALRLELVRPPDHIPTMSAVELLMGKQKPA